MLLLDEQSGAWFVMGEFTVTGGQRAARQAAVQADDRIQRVLDDGQSVTLVAVANFQPREVRAEVSRRLIV